jgi:hypothetical protein
MTSTASRTGHFRTRVGAGTQTQAWFSTDEQWTFERLDGEPGDPWAATYRPTGQEQWFSNQGAARAWAYGGNAETFLRAAARDEDLLLSPAKFEPQSVCECDGYITCIAGAWVHVDVCGSCWDRETSTALACPHPDAHPYCAKPAPTQCVHHGCRGAVSLDSRACDHGRDLCCGCCWDRQ